MPGIHTLVTGSLLLFGLSAQQQPPAAPPPGHQRFFDLANTFHVDLPQDWRQLAPGEVAAVRAANPELPVDITRNEPRMFYAVGPVDRWLAGHFDGVYLYVVQQGNEWLVDEQFAARLQQMWQDKGRHDGIQHELQAIASGPVGRPPGHQAITCIRTSRPQQGRVQQSLDVYAPTGGRQLTLSFTCWAGDHPAWRPRFEAMVASLAFARAARGEPSLGDRLFTPILTGGIVGLLLALLYRRHRRRV